MHLHIFFNMCIHYDERQDAEGKRPLTLTLIREIAKSPMNPIAMLQIY